MEMKVAYSHTNKFPKVRCHGASSRLMQIAGEGISPRRARGLAAGQE